MIARPWIIDVEASGFGAGSYPIEIGVAFPNGRTRCLLIQPMPEWTHWDPAAEAIHRISRQMLLRHGETTRRCCEKLNNWLAGQTVYSDAWGNDSSWLGLLYDSVNILPSFKLDSFRKLLSDEQLMRWAEAKQQAFAFMPMLRHRASTDALVLQEALILSQTLHGEMSNNDEESE